MSSFSLAVPIVIGVTIAVQTAIVGASSASAPPLAVSLALMLGGVLVGGLWAAGFGHWDAVGGVVLRWWWLPLGIAGWVIVAALGWSAARLGVASALTMVVAAQLVAGLVLDAFGDGSVSLRSVVGVLLVVAGVVAMQSG